MYCSILFTKCKATVLVQMENGKGERGKVKCEMEKGKLKMGKVKGEKLLSSWSLINLFTYSHINLFTYSLIHSTKNL